MNAKEKILPKKKEIYLLNIKRFWPKIIIEIMQWFPFHGIMLHKEKYILIPSKNLKSLLNYSQCLRSVFFMMIPLIQTFNQRLLE